MVCYNMMRCVWYGLGNYLYDSYSYSMVWSCYYGMIVYYGMIKIYICIHLFISYMLMVCYDMVWILYNSYMVSHVMVCSCEYVTWYGLHMSGLPYICLWCVMSVIWCMDFNEWSDSIHDDGDSYDMVWVCMCERWYHVIWYAITWCDMIWFG